MGADKGYICKAANVFIAKTENRRDIKIDERTICMVNMDSIIGVNDNTDGIIGKFFYYSIAGILVPRQEFENLGMALGLPKFKPAKASKSGAYRTATTAIKDKVTVKDVAGKVTYQIYCRDNTKEDKDKISRQLVKETLSARTNDYTKLANIIFDKETETVYSENETYDVDVDVQSYCRKAQELYEKFCDCYTTEQVTAVIDDQLSRMQANKISVKGNLFFVPNQYLPLLNILEDYIESLAKYNLNNDCFIVCNSMHVVDSERQREKMAEEFYNNYKRDIELYQKSIQKFIDSGGTSAAVTERWLKKIDALNKKKDTYESILRQRLDNLDKDYSLLKMQAQELIVRNSKAQIKLPLAA